MMAERLALSLPSTEDILLDVIFQLGYPSGEMLKEDIRDEIERAVREGLNKARPACLYRFTPFVRLEKGLVLGRDVEVRSVRLARLVRGLKDPEIVCGFVVTSGQPLEEAINQKQEESLFHAYLLDAVGSVVTERLADQLDQRLSELLGSKGYETTARFSPGYCDWELQEGQEAMFRFLRPESVGVNRTSSGMMIPRKSISAVLVGAREVSFTSPCPFCAKGECPYRREAFRDQGSGVRGQDPTPSS